jgi:hypothetical protein
VFNCVAGIHALFPESEGHQQSVDVVIGVDETFGGRTFAEWQLIATGHGVVDADWLKV